MSLKQADILLGKAIEQWCNAYTSRTFERSDEPIEYANEIFFDVVKEHLFKDEVMLPLRINFLRSLIKLYEHGYTPCVNHSFAEDGKLTINKLDKGEVITKLYDEINSLLELKLETIRTIDESFE